MLCAHALPDFRAYRSTVVGCYLGHAMDADSEPASVEAFQFSWGEPRVFAKFFHDEGVADAEEGQMWAWVVKLDFVGLRIGPDRLEVRGCCTVAVSLVVVLKWGTREAEFDLHIFEGDLQSPIYWTVGAGVLVDNGVSAQEAGEVRVLGSHSLILERGEDEEAVNLAAYARFTEASFKSGGVDGSPLGLCESQSTGVPRELREDGVI